MAPLLTYLRSRGVVTVPTAVIATARERVLDAYQHYLRTERGLVPSSLDNFVRVARTFVDKHGSDR